MPRILEHLVKHLMHLLPDRISVRLDYHTSAYCRTLCKIRLHHKIVIPLGIIVRSLCNLFSHCIFAFELFYIYIADDFASVKVRILQNLHQVAKVRNYWK